MGDATRRYLGEDVQSKALSPSGDRCAPADPGRPTGEAGDDAPDWAAAGLGDLEEFTAYQAIDLRERRWPSARH